MSTGSGMRKLFFAFTFIGLLVASAVAGAEEQVRVFGAASLTNALTDVGMKWNEAGHPLPSLAFAASSALAKQIDSGAPADVFASADLTWMDYLDQRGKIDKRSRVDLLGNDLVLIAPKGR